MTYLDKRCIGSLEPGSPPAPTMSTIPPSQESVAEKTAELARKMNMETWQLVAILVGKDLRILLHFRSFCLSFYIIYHTSRYLLRTGMLIYINYNIYPINIINAFCLILERNTPLLYIVKEHTGYPVQS